MALIASGADASTSIYGSEFDYRKARPAAEFFHGKNRSSIVSFCKQEMLGAMDLSACAQFRYEESASALNREIAKIEAITRATDVERKINEEPEALPYFKEAQKNWVMYRDNECYSETYQAGQASLHFVYFWDCMNRITNLRLKELTSSDD